MMSGRNEATTDELRDQIATLRADFAKFTENASDEVKDGMEAAGRKVARTTRETRDGVIEAVTANPLSAIGLAAGVGYLVGVLTRR